MSAEDKTRRNVLKGSMFAAGVAAAPSFILPVLAQGERLVPFTDVPDSFQVNPVQPDTTHWQDTREIDDFVTDNDDFYLVQHYGQPDIEKDTWRLRVTGMVDNELEFNLSELMNRETIERQIGFECGGNSQRLFHGLIGNADWRGVSLADILQAGRYSARRQGDRFFGADLATEEIRAERLRKHSRAHFRCGRDARRKYAGFEMNGDPLPHYHGKPVRLLVPGWYGVANVKWLTQIHVQSTRYMGRFMGRDYVTLKKENVGGVDRWVENSVTTMNLKSSIIRVTELGGYSIQGLF